MIKRHRWTLGLVDPELRQGILVPWCMVNKREVAEEEAERLNHRFALTHPDAPARYVALLCPFETRWQSKPVDVERSYAWSIRVAVASLAWALCWVAFDLVAGAAPWAIAMQLGVVVLVGWSLRGSFERRARYRDNELADILGRTDDAV